MKPILFNTEMVRAILDGRKTVTREIAKFKNRKEFLNTNFNDSYCEVDKYGKDSYCIYQRIHSCWNEITYPLKPKYQVGDILYVKETFIEYKDIVIYKAGNGPLELAKLSVFFKWKPSIHMPKKYARIFLRVTDVRIERLQDIEEEDAEREGCKCWHWINDTPYESKQGSYINNFKVIWNSTINKKERDEYGWNANPYVFVYEFEVIDREEAIKCER